MAKKRAKLRKAEITMPADIMGKPSLYVDLEADDLDLLKKKKIGDEIILVIRGDLTSISQSKNSGPKGATTGSIRLEDYDVELGDDSIWAKLADDEDDLT